MTGFILLKVHTEGHNIVTLLSPVSWERRSDTRIIPKLWSAEVILQLSSFAIIWKLKYVFRKITCAYLEPSGSQRKWRKIFKLYEFMESERQNWKCLPGAKHCCKCCKYITHLILSTILWSNYYYNFHFTDDKTEHSKIKKAT